VRIFLNFSYIQSSFQQIRTPIGLEDVSTYPKLIQHLLEQGNWTEADIIKLIGGNILRVMEENEKVIVFLICFFY
jgi:microsomal dipeptidase-like Zn-dependent dipeptidase